MIGVEGIHHAPAFLSSFIGRQGEVAEVRNLLAERRLVTLVGPGGVGKTRLALEAAGGVVPDYESVWCVDLAPLADADLVAHTMALGLDLHEQSGRASEDTLIESLNGHRCLIILDNCEHLSATCRPLAKQLLDACGQLRMLVTSRERLGINGEVAWRVPSLSLPRPLARESISAVTEAESVQLFVERARAVQPALTLTPANASAICDICYRLDGIPLAIELAAARSNVLTPEQIANRLTEGFALLSPGSLTTPPRQQTLQATLDWSYGLLDIPEQQLLDRLSVFAGGWDLEAAEFVCSSNGIEIDRVLDLLGGLVDKSLVVAEERSGVMRYRVLETVRQYARTHLEAVIGNSANVRRRHAEHMLKLVESVEPELVGPRQIHWMRHLETEHDNLRAALIWAFAQGDGTSALRLAGAVWRFWWLHGHLGEGAARLDRALSLGTCVSPEVRAKALCGAGNLARVRGELDRADELCTEAIGLYRLSADAAGLAQALISLGNAVFDRGDWARAERCYQDALALKRQAGDERGAAMALHNLAEVARRRGNHPAEEEYARGGLALFRQVGDTWGIALALNDLAAVARARGAQLLARRYYAESLPLFHELGDRWSIAETFESLAELAAEISSPQRAVILLGAAEGLRQNVGSKLTAPDRIRHDRLLPRLRTQLGGIRFAAAWDRGFGLAMEDAVGYALASEGSTGLLTTGFGLGREGQPMLTVREREVAALVAAGLTNRQIADRLVIAVSTAERHLANIREKLGLSSRTQVATWAIAQGLLPG